MWRNVERALLIALGIGLQHLWLIVPNTHHEPQAHRASTPAGPQPLQERQQSPEHASEPAPNIIITLLDDAGAGDAAALGHPLLRTPHIDEFARRAAAFSQAYAGAPNCSPSRASLLTGRASFRTGVYDFLSKSTGNMHFAKRERTVANLLRARGYATAHFGKWHLSRGTHGYSPFHFGFEHSNGSFLAASALLRSFGAWLRHGRGAGRPFFGYLALWEPHEPVHYWSPRRLRHLYSQHVQGHAFVRGGGNEKSGALPASPLASLDSLAPLVVGDGGKCVWRLPERNEPSIYYGAMSQVDESFGWMLAELDRQHVRLNTIVILTSDNGPEHRELNSWGSTGGLRGAKGYVYEGGIRVPFLVQWPGVVSGGRVIHEPVHLWDVLPTVCAAVGMAAPTDRVIDGVSILDLLLPAAEEPNRALTRTMCNESSADDPAAVAAAAELRGEYVPTQPYVEQPSDPISVLGPPQPMPLPRPVAVGLGHARLLRRRTPLFWAMHRGRGGMQYALRSGPWKLIGGYGRLASHGDGPSDGGEVVPWLRTHATIGHVELYLISHDPAERVNLAAAHPHVVVVLLSQMQRLLRETANEGPDVVGWTQRAPPCPRLIRKLNVTEYCCDLANL